MQNDIYITFKKVCDHFDAYFDRRKLDTVLQQVSKEKLRRKIKYDPFVVNLEKDYDKKRNTFKEKFFNMIYSIVYAQNEGLKQVFEK